MSSEDEKPSEGKRSQHTKEEVESLYMKRQQLLREMQESDDTRAIPIREQLKKLEDAIAQQDAPTEDDWGKKSSRRKSGLWMLWVLLGIAVPVVLVGLILLASKTKSRDGGSGAEGLDFDVLNVGEQTQPEDWFVENSGKVTENGIEILEQLSQDDLTREDLTGIVRNDAQIERILQWQENGEWAAFDLSQPTEIRWQFASAGQTGFMALIGPRADFRTFRAYFVRQGDGLVFDADATEGWSEAPIVELPAQELPEPVLLRGWVAKEPHFDARSDADEYSWYQILTPNLIDFVWAYTEAGSELDEALKTELNYGRVIEDRKREFRATVRLAESEVEKFRDDEFLLQELVTTDWVLPIQ
jgi:hypothetical protein